MAPFTFPIFVNLILRHLYILLLQVNCSLKRIICRVILVGMTNLLGLQGLQADYHMKAQWCTKTCSYLLKTLWAVPQWVSVLLSPFLLHFIFLSLSSSLSWAPSPTGLFAFCSSWFLSHFPGGSTSSPIRVAAEQEMADMRVLREEGFFFVCFNDISPYESRELESAILWPLISQPAPA